MKPKIIENTLRDGSYVLDFQVSCETTARVAGGLADLGFAWIEVGHGLGLGAWNKSECGLGLESDEATIAAAKDSAPKAKIGTFFIPGIGTTSDIDSAVNCGIDFLRIGCNVDRYRSAEPYVAHAKSLGIPVFMNLMKSYGVECAEFCEIVKDLASWGLSGTYLVDSAGCMTPDDVRTYISAARLVADCELGFHGHNNLGMANANSYAAVQAGAAWVDTCVRGLGRSAGNAQTEVLIHILNSRSLLETDIDQYRLYDFAENIVAPLTAKQYGLSSDEIHVGVSRFHTSFMPLVDKAIYEHPNVDKMRLIKAVSDINCVNPSEELFMQEAARMDSSSQSDKVF